jgi:hypothetical protein
MDAMTDRIPTLRGRLTFHPARCGEPARLSWRGRCPACRRDHTHGWADPAGELNEVRHRVAHCDAAPIGGRSGYFIALDPYHGAANVRALDAYRRVLAAASESVPTEGHHVES